MADSAINVILFVYEWRDSANKDRQMEVSHIIKHCSCSLQFNKTPYNWNGEKVLTLYKVSCSTPAELIDSFFKKYNVHWCKHICKDQTFNSYKYKIPKISP